MTTTTNHDATAMFRAAYENRYTWDENFPGYTATLTMIQGDGRHQAQVTVQGDFSVAVEGIEDEKIREEMYNQLRDIVTHRKRNSFENAHGKNRFSAGAEDATGAVEILVEGDAMGSNYKVRGLEICQVSRVMGPMAFTINTEKSLDTGDGYISVGYNAVFRDAKSQALRGKRDFQESYSEVGGYYLPQSQVITNVGPGGETEVTEFQFDNLQLLPKA